MGRAPSDAGIALVVLRSNAVETPRNAAFSFHGRVFEALCAIWENEEDDDASIGWLRQPIDGVAPICSAAHVGEAISTGRTDAPDAELGGAGAARRTP